VMFAIPDKNSQIRIMIPSQNTKMGSAAWGAPSMRFTTAAIATPIGTTCTTCRMNVPLTSPTSSRLMRTLASAAVMIRALDMSDAGDCDLVVGALGPPPVSDHHIATNKNTVSALSGGPWTPKMQALFERAGLTLDDKRNIVRDLPWHGGKHSREY